MCLHGDLGVIQRDDLLVALSQSGETPQILRLVEWKKHMRAHCNTTGSAGTGASQAGARRTTRERGAEQVLLVRRPLVEDREGQKRKSRFTLTTNPRFLSSVWRSGIKGSVSLSSV